MLYLRENHWFEGERLVSSACGYIRWRDAEKMEFLMQSKELQNSKWEKQRMWPHNSLAVQTLIYCSCKDTNFPSCSTKLFHKELRCQWHFNYYFETMNPNSNSRVEYFSNRQLCSLRTTAQWLKSLAPIAGPIQQLTSHCTSNSRGSNDLFWPLWAPALCAHKIQARVNWQCPSQASTHLNWEGDSACAHTYSVSEEIKHCQSPAGVRACNLPEPEPPNYRMFSFPWTLDNTHILC